jgi:eukaryotic-like serine/threonine-protein kinase
MAVTIGTQLNTYEVTALLGRGGMGEVYRARDRRLDRDVAIKTLPEEFSTDSDRLLRFEREAKLLASLNHPNIGAIYGFEESRDTRFLVLELVEGETLADRLQRGALSVEESLKLALQIAEALEAAHEKGVIHRDLKPANIKITPDGKVKVLDFGLAKVFASDDAVVNLSNSPTLTLTAAQQGVILGTAAYMSPEQARGRGLDKRTDIWAFGAVLYEMLTGKQVFHGEDVGDILAAVIKSDPNWSLLPEDTPSSIRTLLVRCLRKDRRQRLGDAGTVRIEIEDALASPASAAASNMRPWQRPVPLGVVALVGIVVIGIAVVIGMRLRSPAVQQQRPGMARLNLSLPAGTEVSDRASSVVISPDGTQVAFLGSKAGGVRQLFIRRMDGFESQPLKDTNDATGQFFSPDGQWLGFFADGKLKKLSTTGGVIVTLADADGPGSWGPDDTILFRKGNELLQIPSAGGTAHTIAAPSSDRTERRFQNVDFLPAANAVLFTSAIFPAATVDDRSIEVLRIKTGERKTLIRSGYNPHYVPTGHLIFLRSGTLMAVPFDLDRLELVGTPVPVIEGLRQGFAGSVFSCSEVGSCVYVGGGAATQRTVAFVDRTGMGQALPLAPQNYGHPRFSPAGDKIAFWIEQSICDIVVYDIARGVLTRLTSGADNHFPVWTPDGQQITYISRTTDTPGFELVSKAVDGSGREQRLSETRQNLIATTPLSWVPDGSVLAFVDRGDIWLLPMSGKREPRPFFQSAFNENTPAFSPDGHWLAYTSDESGQPEIYVQPFPGPGAKYPISTNGGTEPVWARSGRELFFRNRDQMMVVQVATQPTFNPSKPRLLFARSFAQSASRVNYDVSPDGERFVVVNAGEGEDALNHINVLLNWFEEFKQRVPVIH